MATVQYEYVPRHLNEDNTFGRPLGTVVGTDPLDTADGDTSYVELHTEPGGATATRSAGTFRFAPTGADAPPVAQWDKAVITIGIKHVDGSLPGQGTLDYVDPNGVVGQSFGTSADYPDAASADGYTLTSMVLLPADLTVDGGFPDPLGTSTYWLMTMYGDIDGATSRYTYAHMTVYATVPDVPPPPPPTMGRPHIHLPVTRENGDLLPYVDVTLIDPATGLEVTPTAFTGPQDVDSEVTWPVTFAPSIVDLWLEEPGRYDLRATGASGFATTYRGIDFEPAPANQVSGDGFQVTNIPMARRWLQSDSPNQARFKDPGLIGPHDHDGNTTHSTTLGHAPDPVAPWLESRPAQVNSEDYRTSLGYGIFIFEQSSGATDMAVLGAAGTTQATDTTVVGYGSGAATSGLTMIGDNISPSVPDDAVRMAYNNGGANPAQVDGWDQVLRCINVWDPDGDSGQVFSSLGYTYDENQALTMPAGIVNRDPIFLRGQARPDSLEVRGNASIGGATGTVGFYGADGATQGPNIADSTDPVITALVAALKGYGLLANT